MADEKLKVKKINFTQPIEVEGHGSDLVVTLTFSYHNTTFKINTALTTKQCSADDEQKNQTTVQELGKMLLEAINRGLQIRAKEMAAKDGTEGQIQLFPKGEQSTEE